MLRRGCAGSCRRRRGSTRGPHVRPGPGEQASGLARGLEDHFQVLALGQADDVQQSRRAKDPEPPADRGQVSGRVPETTVGLLDDQRKGLALAVLEPGGEHAQGAVAEPEQAEPVKLSTTDWS